MPRAEPWLIARNAAQREIGTARDIRCTALERRRIMDALLAEAARIEADVMAEQRRSRSRRRIVYGSADGLREIARKFED